MEVKITNDRKQLFQALKYYIEVLKTMKFLPEFFKDKAIKITLKESPRIILIAKKFSKQMMELSLLIKPKIDFYEYQTYQNQNMEINIIFTRIKSPILQTYSPSIYKIENHIGRIKIKDMKKYCIEIINEIKKIDSSLKVYAIKDRINFRHIKSQWIPCFIKTHQKSFRISAYDFEKRMGVFYHYNNITKVSVKEVNQDLTQILEKIKNSIELLNH